MTGSVPSAWSVVVSFHYLRDSGMLAWKVEWVS